MFSLEICVPGLFPVDFVAQLGMKEIVKLFSLRELLLSSVNAKGNVNRSASLEAVEFIHGVQ